MKSQNGRNQDFSYFFCLMIEGSGSEAGFVPLTSGSGWPSNIRILWIRIRKTAQLTLYSSYNDNETYFITCFCVIKTNKWKNLADKMLFSTLRCTCSRRCLQPFKENIQLFKALSPDPAFYAE